MINFTGLPQIQQKEKGNIIHMFNQLLSMTSYYSQLQFLYNNNQHYSTASSYQNLCTHDMLFNIAMVALYGPNHINVHGTTHTNNHRSNLLINENRESLFVEDTYIRISFWNTPITYMHILMMPPKISVPYNTKIFFNYSNLCNNIVNIIHPIVSYIMIPNTTQSESAKRVLRPSHILQITRHLPKIDMLQTAPSTRVSPPRAQSPKAQSTKAPYPRAPSPRTPSPRASPLRASPPKAPSPRAPSPRAPSPRALPLKASPPKASPPRAQSPKASPPRASLHKSESKKRNRGKRHSHKTK